MPHLSTDAKVSANPSPAMGQVVTRFAPSPTGYLHIGGARTALFNWLFARQAGGTFLLRIEDTDRARSTPEATQAILDGLAWLGLDFDGAPVLQFSRAQRHREAALALVAQGGAYHCYLSAEEEAALKDAARAQGRAFRSPWRDPAFATPPNSAPYVVRLLAPPEDANIVVQDSVMGEVVTKGREIDDFILLRSDLSPTYMLAVVVDDHDMGITHIIRGDDHLTNAARQTALIEAFGWQVPHYSHVPLIHGPDGKKLSKRHGALGVEAYRDMGYLPEAMRAYLLRLGWAKGDVDIIDTDAALALFDLDGLGKSPARLDFAKMDSVNAHFIRLADDARLTELVTQHVAHAGAPVSDLVRARLLAAMPTLKGRAKTVLELVAQCGFILSQRPLPLDDKAQKALTPEAKERLARLRDVLAETETWDQSHLQAALDGFAAQEGVGFGKIGPNLRAALTGGQPAPDLVNVMDVLGQDEVIGRLADVL